MAMTIEEIEAQINELEKQKDVLEEAEREKKQKQKQKRYKEVMDAYNKFVSLKKAYLEDYQEFAFFESSDDEPHFLTFLKNFYI